MNEQKVVEGMIDFIEEKERQIQANRLLSDKQARNDVVKAILNELECEISNED